MKTLVRAAALALALTLAPQASAATPKAAAKPAAAKAAEAKAAEAQPSESKPSDAKAPEAKPADAKPAAWKEYQLAESGFAVKLPGEPERTETSQGPLNLRTYGVEGAAGQPSFGVVCMTFEGVDGELPAEALDEMSAAMAKQPGIQVTKDEKLTVGGRPARHLEMTGDDGQAHVAMRVVLGTKRIYQVMAVAKGGGSLASPEVKSFFESFRPLP